MIKALLTITLFLILNTHSSPRKTFKIKYGYFPISMMSVSENSLETGIHTQIFTIQYLPKNLLEVGIEFEIGDFKRFVEDARGAEYKAYKVGFLVSKTGPVYKYLNYNFGLGTGIVQFDGVEEGWISFEGTGKHYPAEKIDHQSYYANLQGGIVFLFLNSKLGLELMPLNLSVGTKNFFEFTPKFGVSLSF